MKDIPESEAFALLADPLFCQDVPAWSFNKLKPGLATLECGLVHKDGVRTGMHLALQFNRSVKTGIVTFKFTVFKLSLGAPQRVYQLQINAVARAPKNWHDLVHEHMGDGRILGTEAWLTWGFSDALDYFSKRANITFDPPALDPEEFSLKS